MEKSQRGIIIYAPFLYAISFIMGFDWMKFLFLSPGKIKSLYIWMWNDLERCCN